MKIMEVVATDPLAGMGGQGPVRRRLEAVEGAGHDVHEGGHHQDGEEPAEEQEELLTRLADVGLNDIADGAPLVLHRGVHGGEVLDGAEEDAAQQDPQQHRHPAEDRGLDGAVDGGGAGDGGELVAEDHVGVRRNIVHAVLQLVGRRLGLGVDAPGPGQIAAVDEIGRQQYDNGDDQNHQPVHEKDLLLAGPPPCPLSRPTGADKFIRWSGYR